MVESLESVLSQTNKENIAKKLQTGAVKGRPKISNRLEICRYYETHSLRETSHKFGGISYVSITNIFKEYHNGNPKQDFSKLEQGNSNAIKIKDKSIVAKYYLTHSLKETMSKFGMNAPAIAMNFKRYHEGLSKSDYLERKNPSDHKKIEYNKVPIKDTYVKKGLFKRVWLAIKGE
ncbi:hypothetical protein RND61_14915 [Streptomyces sp. TRM76323]|uniref:Transposase n=1 Tax=Streptomyces tamarix TaxID=3078565 RepID=A0ABU3QKQ9_9ACTN|nr:hypothetical protein [Streptomyces tamarix]MDT9683355.1 hypothetical protein [Streptomyces tamarix]